MNLATILTDSAGAGADHVALKLDEAEVTYGQLDAATALMAGLLAEKGVSAGDRVGIMLPNVPYFAVCYYGALRAGAVVVPMNVLLKRREVAFYLRDPEARLLLAWHGFAEDAVAGGQDAGVDCILVKPGEFEQLVAAARPAPEVLDADDSDTAVILYTSGTTGTPKGAELTHENLRRNCEIAGGLFSVGPETVTLGALPLFHSFGQTCGLNATIAGGGTLTLIPRFDPGKALEIIQRDRVTVFEGVPTMYNAILHHPEAASFDTSTLSVCASGGAAMPVEVMHGFEQKFGCKVLEGYGLSETSPVASFNHPDRERKAGSIGTPVEGVEMKVVDEEGHDLPAGYFFIVDRKKDLIIRGGYNVYPREIEEVLYEHPAVREVAVVGVPHRELGEEVGAAVALKDGAEATPDELREHVKAQVAAYKYPRQVWLVDELPKGPTGKILKREIERPEPAEAAPNDGGGTQA